MQGALLYNDGLRRSSARFGGRFARRLSPISACNRFLQSVRNKPRAAPCRDRAGWNRSRRSRRHRPDPVVVSHRGIVVVAVGSGAGIASRSVIVDDDAARRGGESPDGSGASTWSGTRWP